MAHFLVPEIPKRKKMSDLNETQVPSQKKKRIDSKKLLTDVKAPVVVGKSKASCVAFPLNDMKYEAVNKYHFLIEMSDSRLSKDIKDLVKYPFMLLDKSSSGTYVNEKQVPPISWYPLQECDVVSPVDPSLPVIMVLNGKLFALDCALHDPLINPVQFNESNCTENGDENDANDPGQELTELEAPFIIGTNARSPIKFPESPDYGEVRNMHCIISKYVPSSVTYILHGVTKDPLCMLMDLNSSGTFVNDEKVEPLIWHPIFDNYIISVVKEHFAVVFVRDSKLMKLPFAIHSFLKEEDKKR